MLSGVPCGIDVQDCSHISITGCTIHDAREVKKSLHAVRFTGQGQGNLIALNSVGRTTGLQFALDDSAGVTTEGNILN